MTQSIPKVKLTPSQRLIERIRRELPQVPVPSDAFIEPYRGRKDGGAFAWTMRSPTVSLVNIMSAETVKDLLKAEKLATTKPDQYQSSGWEIGSGR